MSLKENGTNAHARGLAQQPSSLRKPMAKSPAPDMESFMTNGPKDPSASNSGMAWPIKNPSLMAPAPGENACWSNRLFDLDALKSLSLSSSSPTPNINPNDGLWQSLNKNNIITDDNNTNVTVSVVKDIASTPKGVDSRMYTTHSHCATPLPVTPTSSVVGAPGGAW